MTNRAFAFWVWAPLLSLIVLELVACGFLARYRCHGGCGCDETVAVEQGVAVCRCKP